MADHRLPSIGRIVQYRLPLGWRNATEYRPAIITRVWSDPPTRTSAVQLQVFTDGANDGLENVVWATSVVEGPDPGQYRWPVQVGG